MQCFELFGQTSEQVSLRWLWVEDCRIIAIVEQVAGADKTITACQYRSEDDKINRVVAEILPAEARMPNIEIAHHCSQVHKREVCSSLLREDGPYRLCETVNSSNSAGADGQIPACEQDRPANSIS